VILRWHTGLPDVRLCEAQIQEFDLAVQDTRIQLRAHVHVAVPTGNPGKLTPQFPDVVVQDFRVSLVPLRLRPHAVPGVSQNMVGRGWAAHGGHLRRCPRLGKRCAGQRCGTRGRVLSSRGIAPQAHASVRRALAARALKSQPETKQSPAAVGRQVPTGWLSQSAMTAVKRSEVAQFVRVKSPQWSILAAIDQISLA
jgi:hypothetical protein